MKPSEALALQRSRKSPFQGTYGCAEMENIAEAVIEALVKEGDTWETPINWAHAKEWLKGHSRYLGNLDQLIDHYHSGGSHPQFAELYTKYGYQVNTQFIEQVCQTHEDKFYTLTQGGKVVADNLTKSRLESLIKKME